jgi:hypothetical protein
LATNPPTLSIDNSSKNRLLILQELNQLLTADQKVSFNHGFNLLQVSGNEFEIPGFHEVDQEIENVDESEEKSLRNKAAKFSY